jgi:ATP-dependent Lon protease
MDNIFEEANKAEVSLEINEKIHTPNCIEEKYYPFYNGDDKRTDFIKTIQSNVNNNKSKKLGFDDTANIIITTLQSYLTIFSGPPGVGKTSTREPIG